MVEATRGQDSTVWELQDLPPAEQHVDAGLSCPATLRDDADDLAPAVGIALGVPIGLAMWLLILWAVFRLGAGLG